MTTFIVKKKPLGTTLEPGMIFVGEDAVGGDVRRTDVDPPVIIPFGFAEPLEGDVPKITTPDDKIRFCETATVIARQEKTDRDYLVSVAYYHSANLTKFGKFTDSRIGPFQFTIKEWIAATAPFNAPIVQYPPTDLFQWNRQITPAARRAAEKTKAYNDAKGRLPMPVELYFFERMDSGAIDFLKLAEEHPETTCEAITIPAPDGSFSAEIKGMTGRRVGALVQEVRDGLMKGFGDSRADINKLPAHNRYFHDEDWAPWLAVAQMMKGDSLQTSTDKLPATFMSTIVAAPTPSAAFVAFCMIFCGEPAVKSKLPPANMEKPQTWATWGAAAPDPAPAGAVVLTNATVAQGIGILAEPATKDPVQVWLCSRNAGTVKVEVKEVAKTAITMWRWLDLSATVTDAQAVVRAPGSNDGLFVEKAPGIIAKLIADFMLSDIQAAAILGNIGHECGGFRSMQEIHPTGQDGRGGLGWCQWTDTRRTSFEAFAATHGGVLRDDANYGYLKQELDGPQYSKVVKTLRDINDMRQAVEKFERGFEVADLATVNYESRMRYAGIALGLHRQKLDTPIS